MNGCIGKWANYSFRWSILGCGILSGASFASADWLSSFFARDVDVVSVTDMTDVGRTYVHATPEKPVYYMIVDAGQRTFGRSWAGEKVPKSRVALNWMMTAMAEQSYRLADGSHPPTQLFVFGWGMMQGSSERPALKFLGGDKVDMRWEGQQYPGTLSGQYLTTARSLKRHGIAGKVWDFAEDDLFLGVVRSYTIHTANSAKATQLWETRFACPAAGLFMVDAMPLMIKVAAANLGRESTVPVNVNASDAVKGRVDLGELKFLGTVPSVKNESPKPDPDTSKSGG